MQTSPSTQKPKPAFGGRGLTSLPSVPVPPPETEGITRKDSQMSIVYEQYNYNCDRLKDLTDCIEKRFDSVLRPEPTQGCDDCAKTEETYVALAEAFRNNNRRLSSTIYRLESILQRCELPQ